MTTPPKAIILLSGGLDSTTCLAYAKSKGYALYAITFNYGQRHLFEIEAAKKIAKAYGVQEHIITQIDMKAIKGSALTDVSIDVPKQRSGEEISSEIPVTYVPARNTIFLSFALAWAEVLPSNAIFIGVNAIDYSGYPDCRPEFIEAFQKTAHLATKAGVSGDMDLTIHTPLLRLTKAEIIELGLSLGVDYSMTSTCYDPNEDGSPCGHCDACQLRINGFKTLGLTDPVMDQMKNQTS